MNRHLSKQYERDFEAMLSHVSTLPPRRSGTELGICWPEIGKTYPDEGGLFVIGRATNGTSNGFRLVDLASSNLRLDLITKGRAAAEQYQLEWVGNQYESTGQITRRIGGTTGSRSAFWRIARGTLQLVQGDATTASWWDSIAWSNIAKVAPKISGNPPDWLGLGQAEMAWDLVQKEVRELNPGVVLLVTGGWVDKKRLESISATARAGGVFVKHSSKFDGRKWLVVERPEHQRQDLVLNEIATALRELS